jgi:LysR family cyn operon transcriptional activator
LVLVISSHEIELPIQKVPLFTSNMVMAVSKSHSLASLDKIAFKKIEDVPLILPEKDLIQENMSKYCLKNTI